MIRGMRGIECVLCLRVWFGVVCWVVFFVIDCLVVGCVVVGFGEGLMGFSK